MFAPAQHLQRHAADRPDALALVALDARWTFAELDRCVAAVAQRLRELGIEPRHLVAIDLPPEEDWIVTLALLRIATATVSLAGVSDLGGLPVDALLTRPGTPRFGAPVVVAIDRLWIEQAVADADERDDRAATVLYARDDAVCRVIMTSGTTGSPRGAALSVRAVQHRLENLHRYWTDHRVELTMMTLSTTGGFHTALANLQHGTPYLAIPTGDAATARIAAEQRVEVVCGSPVQVGRFVQLVREAGIALPDLRAVQRPARCSR
jgi:acyl-coenzyme A synthetase/AMP-(fatty) acid ligase